MASSFGKTWYINNTTNKIYRLDNYGYSMSDGEKHILLKDIENGTRWIMPSADLHKQVIIEGKPTALWEEMPEGWHPISEEKRYPGYINDPRKDGDNYEYNNYGGRNSFRSTATGYSSRERVGFRR